MLGKLLSVILISIGIALIFNGSKVFADGNLTAALFLLMCGSSFLLLGIITFFEKSP